MKIALVCCPVWSIKEPPLSIATLQAVLNKNNYEVISFDFNIKFYYSHKIRHKMIQILSLVDHGYFTKLFYGINLFNRKSYNSYIKKIIESGAEVICFTTYKSNGLISEYFAKKIKEIAPGKKIIFGGPFVSSSSYIRERLTKSKDIDFIIIGEGERLLLRLLNSIKKNRLKRKEFKIREAIKSELIDLNKEPIPDFKWIPINKYQLRFIPYMPTRGCPYKCTFCFDQLFWKNYRTKTPKKILNDLKKLKEKYKQKNFSFTASSLINADKKKLEELCDLIIKNKLKIKWVATARCKNLDRIILKKMKNAGCRLLIYGIESGSQKILNDIKKGYKIKELEDILKLTNELGIKVKTTFMVGYPTETWSDFYKTIKFLYKNRKLIDLVSSTPACPIEGTELYKKTGKSIFWSSNNSNLLTRFTKLIIFKTATKLFLTEIKEKNLSREF